MIDYIKQFRKEFKNRLPLPTSHYGELQKDLEFFLSQALTRIEEETMEKALWCQFCGDELSCFGCEGIPGRTMEENRKLLLASLPPSEEKPLKDTDVPKKEKRGR